jgi:hypothetical protein
MINNKRERNNKKASSQNTPAPQNSLTPQVGGSGAIQTSPTNSLSSQTVPFAKIQEIIVNLDPQTALHVVLSQLGTISKQLDDERSKNIFLNNELSVRNNNEIQLKLTINYLEQEKQRLERLVSELTTKLDHLEEHNEKLKYQVERLEKAEQKRQNKEKCMRLITAINDVSNELSLRDKKELCNPLCLLSADRNVTHHYIHKSKNPQSQDNDSPDMIQYKIVMMRKQLDNIPPDVLKMFSDYGDSFIDDLKKYIVPKFTTGTKLYERTIKKYWDDE